MRSGTENLPAIAAMAKALRLLLTDEAGKVAKQQAIRQAIVAHIQSKPAVHLFSQLDGDFAPHILCFAIAGVRGETIVHAFEQEQVYISTTSACSSKKGTESSTLAAMHIQGSIATSAIRVSLDEYNTMEEAAAFNAAFDRVYAGFSKLISA